MSFLVNGIKAQAEGEEDADLQKRLLAAAKNLADATAKMVEAAKVSSKILQDIFSSLNVLFKFSPRICSEIPGFLIGLCCLPHTH
jgi:hypothetical protein